MVESTSMYLDPAIRDWVLLPIMVVMVLVGILRHFITLLLNTPQKPQQKAIRESGALQRSSRVRMNGNHITQEGFQSRKHFLSEAFEKGSYLKAPANANATPNPMDAGGMDMMMDAMKKNMAMIVPQTLIMNWVIYFFSGFVSLKLPFVLTNRFKAMLQRGIETPDMDVTWVSSLSWYFLNLFGLQGVYALLLGEENTANDLRQMQQMAPGMAPQGGMPGAMPDMSKAFLAEKENLDIAQHKFELEEVEDRVLAKFAQGKSKRV